MAPVATLCLVGEAAFVHGMSQLTLRLRPPVAALAIGLCSAGCAHQRPEPELQIVNVLNAQADAWNRGDLEAFMEPYWKSDELTYSAAGRTTSGWAELLANYKGRYPTRQDMGRLAFDGLRIRLLSCDAALVTGRWHLDRDGDPVGGTFSLVFQRIGPPGADWVIIHDHTSAAPSTPAPAPLIEPRSANEGTSSPHDAGKVTEDR